MRQVNVGLRFFAAQKNLSGNKLNFFNEAGKCRVTFFCRAKKSKWEQTEFFSMRQLNVGLRFFAAQKNLTQPTWLKV